MSCRSPLFAAALLAVVALASCSTERQVEDALIDSLKERLIAIGLEDPNPVADCPGDLEGGAGKTYDCDVEVADVEFRIEVEFSDNTNFRARIVDFVVPSDEASRLVERQLQADDAIEASVDCGEPLVVFRTDAVTTCSADIEGQAVPVEVQANDDSSISARLVQP